MNEPILRTFKPDKFGRYHETKKRKHTDIQAITAIALFALLCSLAPTNSIEMKIDAADAAPVEIQEIEAETSAAPEEAAADRPIATFAPSGNQALDEVIAIAQEHNFQWIGYLVKLTTCENRGHDPLLQNCKGNSPAGSCDRGIFQINSYWHSEIDDACAFDIECSTLFTINMINEGRQHEWVCDAIVRGVAK